MRLVTSKLTANLYSPTHFPFLNYKPKKIKQMETQLKEIALQLRSLNAKFQSLIDLTKETKEIAKNLNIGSEGDNEKQHSEK